MTVAMSLATFIVPPPITPEPIIVIRGDSYTDDGWGQLEFTKSYLTPPTDLTDWVVTLKVGTLVISGTVTTPTGPVQLVKVPLTAGNTFLLAPGNYNYEVEVVNGTTVMTPWRGTIRVQDR